MNSFVITTGIGTKDKALTISILENTSMGVNFYKERVTGMAKGNKIKTYLTELTHDSCRIDRAIIQ